MGKAPTNMHHSDLAKISSDWIVRFISLETKLMLLYDPRWETDLRMEVQEHKAFFRDPEHIKELEDECEEDLSNLKDHPLEVHLKSTIQYRHILTAINSKKVEIDNSLYSRNQTKHIDSDRGFELSIIRVIAGGLWLYCDPLYFGQKGIEVGALKKIEPTAKMAKAADSLLSEMSKSGFRMSNPALNELMEIATETAKPRLAVDKKIEAVIREVSLLGLRYLNLKGGQRSRFPNQCIERIFDILGESVHPKVIQRTQRDYDSYPYAETIMSDNIHNLPKHPLVFNTNSSKSLLSG